MSEREEFKPELLRQRYSEDPVALAMIDYIEELLARPSGWINLGGTWAPGPATWKTWTTTATNTSPKIKDINFDGTLTIEWTET